MWGAFKKMLGGSKTLNSLLGDVVFETPAVRGQTSYSDFQWRVKKGLDDRTLFIALTCRADGSVSVGDAERHHISFDIATAEQIRAHLDSCIAEHHRRSKQAALANPSASVIRRD